MNDRVSRTVQCCLPLLLSLGLSASCTGSIEGSTAVDEPPVANGGGGGSGGGGGNGGPSPDTALRRLTRTEYNNTIRDLLGDTSQPGNALNPDQLANGFDNNADRLNLSAFAVDKYDAVAGNVVENAFRPKSASRAKLLGTCEPVAGACARTVVSTFVRRAWRRPVDGPEVDDLMTALDDVAAQGDNVEEGVKLAFRIALVSPNFVYRVEADPPGGTGLHPVSPDELATRLSYFLWASMPDSKLFDAAEAMGGANLSKSEVFTAEVERMLGDAKADTLVSNFAAQWLDTRMLDEAVPDRKTFGPFYDKEADLRKAMVGESQYFFREFLNRGLPIADMLDTDFTFVNDRLAKYYGIPAGVTGSQMRRVPDAGVGVPLPPHRFGLLSQAGILTTTSNATRTSPVKRGKWVLSRLLCSPPPPPVNAPPLPDDAAAAKLPLRQRLEAHRTNPVCASCHASMDPIGFALEHYNGIGLWRTAYPNGAIDDSGKLAFPDGTEVTFSGAQDLSQKLKQDPRLARCFAKTMFAYALGRSPQTEGDQAAIGRLTEGYVRKGERIRDLITLIASSQAFQLRGGQ